MSRPWPGSDTCRRASEELLRRIDAYPDLVPARGPWYERARDVRETLEDPDNRIVPPGYGRDKEA